MKNLLNTSKSYKDPRVYRDLKIGFACVVILGILIAFAVSPKLRHEIGIGPAHPVATPKVYHHPNKPPVLNHVRHQGQGKHTHSGRQSNAHGHSHPTQGHNESQSHGGLEGVTQPPSNPHPEPGSGNNNPAPIPAQVTPPPTASPPSHPSEDNGGEQSASPPVEVEAHGKGKVIIEVPGVELPPVVEETTHGVDGVVNGVTGAVEETTKQLPVHTEVPEICVLKC